MAESDPGDVSERYEFDAPSEVVDLKELEYSENDDKWFGKSLFNSVIRLLLSSCQHGGHSVVLAHSFSVVTFLL